MPYTQAYMDPDLYDLVYSWYDHDLAFYVDAAKAAGGPVLEIGCGTGRILLPTLEAGVDIEGIDLDPGMLEGLRRKAAAKGLAPRVQVGDMRHFTLARRFRLITIPFRAFMHLLTTEDQLRALRCAREHLEPGGALTYNLFFPSMDYMVAHADTRELEREIVDPRTGLPVAVYSTPHYDPVGQILTVQREIVESDPRGYAGTTHRTGFTIRWTYRWEMELLLRTAGFTRFQVRGGFDGRPLERDTDEMVWTAWKD